MDTEIFYIELIEELNKKYIVIKTSFEGIGDDIFETEEKFCEIVFSIFARSVRFIDKELYNKLKYYADKTKNFNDLQEGTIRSYNEHKRFKIMKIFLIYGYYSLIDLDYSMFKIKYFIAK